MSSLSDGLERNARRARDALRRRQLEHGEVGWGPIVVPPPVLPAREGQPRRVAIVGAGPQGVTLAEAAASIAGVELVGFAEPEAERRADVAQRFGLDPSACHAEAADLYASGPIDLVAVATPAPHHVRLAAEAHRHGVKRILVEKPIDVDHQAAAALAARCAADGVLLAVNYSRRWMSDFRGILAAVRDGAVGDVRTITAQTGGGELAMNSSHFFDFGRMLLEGDDAVEVSARLRPTRAPNRRGAQYDDPTGQVLVRFGSGARTYIDFEDDLPRGTAVVSIRGEHGTIVVEEHRSLWTLRSRSTRLWTFPFARPFTPIEMATQVMFGMLAEDVPACGAADGLAALDYILAAHWSSEDGGRAVALPLTDEQRSLRLSFP